MISKKATVAPATRTKRKVPADDRKKPVRRLRQNVLAGATKSGGVRKILKPKARGRATFASAGPARDSQALLGSGIIQQPRLWPDSRGYNDSLLTRRNKRCSLSCDQARQGERSWAFERAKKRDKRFSSFGDAMKLKEKAWMDIGDNFVKDVLNDQVTTQYGNPTGITAVANYIVSSWEPLNHIGNPLEIERGPLAVNDDRVDAYDGKTIQSDPIYPLLPLRDSDYSGAATNSRTEPLFGQPSVPRTRLTTRTTHPPTDNRTTTSTTTSTPYSAGTGVVPVKVDLPGITDGRSGLMQMGSTANGSSKTDQETILSRRCQQRQGNTSLIGLAGRPNEENRGASKGAAFTESAPNIRLKRTTPRRTLHPILEVGSLDGTLDNDKASSDGGLGAWKLNPPTPVFAHGVISTKLINGFFSEDTTASMPASEAAPEILEARKTQTRLIPSPYTVDPETTPGTIFNPGENV